MQEALPGIPAVRDQGEPESGAGSGEGGIPGSWDGAQRPGGERQRGVSRQLPAAPPLPLQPSGLGPNLTPPRPIPSRCQLVLLSKQPQSLTTSLCPHRGWDWCSSLLNGLPASHTHMPLSPWRVARWLERPPATPRVGRRFSPRLRAHAGVHPPTNAPVSATAPRRPSLRPSSSTIINEKQNKEKHPLWSLPLVAKATGKASQPLHPLAPLPCPSHAQLPECLLLTTSPPPSSLVLSV